MKKIMLIMVLFLSSCTMKDKPVVLSDTLNLEIQDSLVENSNIEVVNLKEILPANFDFRILSCDEKTIGFGVWESGKFAAYQFQRMTHEINAINKYEVSVFIDSFSYGKNLYLMFLKYKDEGYHLQIMNQSDDILELDYRTDKVPYVEMIDNELFFTAFDKTEKIEEDYVMSYSLKDKKLKEITRFSSTRNSENNSVISCLGGMDSMLYFQVVEFEENEVVKNFLYSYDLRSHELNSEIWNETLDYVNGTKKKLFTSTNTFHQSMNNTHKIIDYEQKKFDILPESNINKDYVGIEEIDYHDVLLATNQECYILSDNVLRKIIKLDQINDVLVYEDNILIVGGGKLYLIENEAFRKQKFKEVSENLKKKESTSQLEYLYETGETLFYLESRVLDDNQFHGIVWKLDKVLNEYEEVTIFEYQTLMKDESLIHMGKFVLKLDHRDVLIELN